MGFKNTGDRSGVLSDRLVFSIPIMAMTAAQYRAAIETLGLSQVEAARFLGVNDRTSRHWASDSPPPEAVAKLLRLMIRLKISPDKVR